MHPGQISCVDFDPYQSGGSLQRVATLFQDGYAIAHSPSLVSRLWIAPAWFHCTWRCSLQRWRWWAGRDDHSSQRSPTLFQESGPGTGSEPDSLYWGSGTLRATKCSDGKTEEKTQWASLHFSSPTWSRLPRQYDRTGREKLWYGTCEVLCCTIFFFYTLCMRVEANTSG